MVDEDGGMRSEVINKRVGNLILENDGAVGEKR